MHAVVTQNHELSSYDSLSMWRESTLSSWADTSTLLVAHFLGPSQYACRNDQLSKQAVPINAGCLRHIPDHMSSFFFFYVAIVKISEEETEGIHSFTVRGDSRTKSVYFILYISIWVETLISYRWEIWLLIDDGLRPLHVWNNLGAVKLCKVLYMLANFLHVSRIVTYFFEFTVAPTGLGGALLQHLVLVLWAAEGIFHSHFLLPTSMFT